MAIISDDHKWCLYYKSGIALVLALARVVNYASRVTVKIVASLTGDSWGIIYERNIFIVQTIGIVNKAGSAISGDSLLVPQSQGKPRLSFNYYTKVTNTLAYRSKV
jgi:hypothetical protein